jgi:transketolase
MGFSPRAIATKAAGDAALQLTRNLENEIAFAARFVRQHVIASIYRAGSGHPGGSLSCADLLAVLFGAELNVWPNALDDPIRDRFVLSKGHAAPALYAIAAHHGFCDKKASLVQRKTGSKFQGRPHVGDLPWVETSTGSPGQGFSVALGMAIGLKMQKSPARAYALLGSGELQEGEAWEGAMCAAHHKLDNFCVIIDYHSSDTGTAMRLEPLAAKWRAFDWAVGEIDGHDIQQILSTFRRASATRERPCVIIAHAAMGKGVPYMENTPAWHGSVRLTHEQAEEALQALGASCDEIREYLDDDAG